MLTFKAGKPCWHHTAASETPKQIFLGKTSKIGRKRGHVTGTGWPGSVSLKPGTDCSPVH